MICNVDLQRSCLLLEAAAFTTVHVYLQCLLLNQSDAVIAACSVGSYYNIGLLHLNVDMCNFYCYNAVVADAAVTLLLPQLSHNQWVHVVVVVAACNASFDLLVFVLHC